MKIERVDLMLLKLPIVGHFETSYERVYEEEKLILKFYTPDFVAYTECVSETSMRYSYETNGTAIEVLKSHLLPAVMGKELTGPEDFWKLCGDLRGHPMTKASVENAFWIFKALEKNISLAALLGNKKDRVVAGVSVGIQDSTKELVEQVDAYLAQGYPKVKLKIKPGADIEYIKAVRESFPDIKLMVDANNAYSLEDIDIFKAMDAYNLLMIEQPLAANDIFYHSKLQTKLKTPVCLDESIHNPYHAKIALEMNACSIINIKQGRVGGLSNAIEIHDIYSQAGFGVWCGGMFETGIGRALIIAMAGLDNFIYPSDISASDRYYHEELINQKFTLNSDGTITVPQGTGLGVEINEKILDKYTYYREVIRF